MEGWVGKITPARRVHALASAAICLATLAVNSCCLSPTTLMEAGDDSIVVGNAEIFENTDLQSSLDSAKAQLAAVSTIGGPALNAALTNVQGFSSNQTSFSVQALGSPLPQVVTTSPTGSGAGTSVQPGSVVTTQPGLTPALPSSLTSNAPSAPPLAPASATLLDRQLQLASQVAGYQLLLSGSDFSRYTSSGATKDRIVIGIPITINPDKRHRDKAAEVTVEYYPPNSKQFIEPEQFTKFDTTDTQDICEGEKYSSTRKPPANNDDLVDLNGPSACHIQERLPTIVNVLPTERAYDTISVTNRSSSIGLGAIVGTVSVGASGGSSKQTQYLIAQQELIGFSGRPFVSCPPSSTNGAAEKNAALDATASDRPTEHGRIDVDLVSKARDLEVRKRKNPNLENLPTVECQEGATGVEVKWQFRPVLGQHYVRPGQRRVFVQIAIPYARRPYPNYGGTIRVSRVWLPYDPDQGIVAKLAKSSVPPVSQLVFGPPFFDSVVSNIKVRDIGNGNALTTVTGRFLMNARVRVGASILDSSTSALSFSNTTMEFIAPLQALAQYGAIIKTSGGVDAPLIARSICKAADKFGECLEPWNFELADHDIGKQKPHLQSPDKSRCVDKTPERFNVKRITIAPAGDSTSLVTVELCSPLDLPNYKYYEYYRDREGVVGIEEERKPDLQSVQDINTEARRRINALPIVVLTGGKVYGFSDSPFQYRADGKAAAPKIAFIATNDSLDSFPLLQVRRLFGDPELDSEWVRFVSPGRLRFQVNENRLTAQ